MTDTFDRLEDLLSLDGSMPERIRVVDVTPEGHATPLFSVVLDYGWAQTVTSPEYKHVAEAIAVSWADHLSIPVEGP